MRKIGNKLLPPFPNGWYKLATSKEIKSGTAKHIDCIGENFVVFRSTDSKKTFVLDAYCPHMGANLGKLINIKLKQASINEIKYSGVGGIVNGDCIECPFHQWKFDGESGSLVNIPYSESLSDGKFLINLLENGSDSNISYT